MLDSINIMPVIFAGPVIQPKLANRAGQPLSDFDATPQPTLKTSSRCPGAAQITRAQLLNFNLHTHSVTATLFTIIWHINLTDADLL